MCSPSRKRFFEVPMRACEIRLLCRRWRYWNFRFRRGRTNEPATLTPGFDPACFVGDPVAQWRADCQVSNPELLYFAVVQFLHHDLKEEEALKKYLLSAELLSSRLRSSLK